MKKQMLMLAACLATAMSFAATYYVSPTGDDNNAGTSDAPVATIKKGVALASAAGDIVSIADGDYEIGAKITVSKAITIQGNVTDCSKVVVNCKGTQHALYNDSVDGWVVSGITFTNIYRAVYSKKAITVSHCAFRQVKSGSTLGGEGLCFPAGSADGLKLVEDCEFDNLVSGGKGAIYLDGTFPITLRNCVFRGCVGGAVRQNAGGGIELTAENCEFSDCTSWGGAVGLLQNSGKTQAFRNCLFSGNEVTVSGWTACGGAVSTASSSATYENCTFVDNSCPLSPSGAAVYANGGEITMVNCVFWNNLILSGTGGTVTKEASVVGSNYTATSCAAPSAAPLTGNTNVALSASPFVAPGVYTLVEKIGGVDNPCIDGGSTLDWMTGAKDLAGNDRINNSVPDMGAYEYYAVTKKLGSLMYIDLQ